jgi:hypothetical protein
MHFRHKWQKAIIMWLALIAMLFALFSIFNPWGYRARIVARLFRTDNGPIVVPLPQSFVPHVPSGFNASVLAKGFDEPRWLAVAPNGDVFVADSAARKVIVLRPAICDCVP